MTIEGTNGPTKPGAVIYEFKRTAAPKQARPGPATGDVATFTERARRVGKAGPFVDGSAEIRPDLVRELKAAIADGTYKADDRAVARKLLARGL